MTALAPNPQQIHRTRRHPNLKRERWLKTQEQRFVTNTAFNEPPHKGSGNKLSINVATWRTPIEVIVPDALAARQRSCAFFFSQKLETGVPKVLCGTRRRGMEWSQRLLRAQTSGTNEGSSLRKPIFALQVIFHRPFCTSKP